MSLAGCAIESVDPDASDESDVKSLDGVTGADRKRYLQASQVWQATQIEKKDILRGNERKGAFELNEEVVCKFVEPTEKDQLGGASPKFECGSCEDGCTLESGDTVKVKYFPVADGNGEIFAEVLGSRLLWALGFASDDVYPVRVTCKDCPEDPWETYKSFTPNVGPRGDKRFPYALIERKHKGKKIEETGKVDQGWSWRELGAIDPEKGGAPEAHVDALKLLAVFMQHGDNKAENQRMVCLEVDDAGKCARPFLIIHDVGATFGQAGLIKYGHKAKARFNYWDETPIWRNEDRCQGELLGSVSGTMHHPFVGDEGRAFLAELLDRLSDKQIRDLFVAARIDERPETIELPGGGTRKVTVDDWVATFKRKRDEIRENRCTKGPNFERVRGWASSLLQKFEL